MDTLMFDIEEEKSGCKKMCDIINGKLSEHLFDKLSGRSLDIETLKMADNELLEYYNSNIAERGEEGEN